MKVALGSIAKASYIDLVFICPLIFMQADHGMSIWDHVCILDFDCLLIVGCLNVFGSLRCRFLSLRVLFCRLYSSALIDFHCV